ncbi:hypothetical protein [Chitinimonas sp. BJB300]|uniref:hypothetical protein n=1 Tax=Chitinimonas sp. BJB300 TaxID=1559339 RepID=UPI000C109E1E|nr:hypothetical protein [Chitinimonas sp. BJB300]PHV11907.1 hypothetical protein CSQ89_08600 [Chitinimonas sp. BJB300]
MLNALRVPEPITGSAITVETNPRAVKAWLVSLSSAQTAETARAIFDSLTTLNRIKLDGESRLKLLEHYQTTINMLDVPLEAIYACATAPAKEKAKHAAVLARNLQLELANGYKLVLHERLSARFGFGKRDIPELIHHLLTTYQRLMWICCKSYGPVPAGVWLEAHALFRYAIQHKMIDSPEGVDHQNKTIGGCYKQILLLALSDPYRYHPLEHDKIKDLIKNYGSATQFQALNDNPHPAGLFLVRLDQDLPPAFFGQRPQDVEASSSIMLDTIEMAKLLNKALHAVEQKLPTASDRSKAQAWMDLLRRVSRQWSISPKRIFQRIRANSQVQMTGGLRMTTFHLNDAQPLFEPLALDDSLPLTDNPLTFQEGVHGQPDTWILLNESPGGFALRLKPLPQSGIYRVGDVVGLRSQGADDWMVACIRWMQTTETGDAVEVGIQILAPSGNSGMVRPTTTHAGGTLQPCLQLPEITAIKRPALILAPRGTFTPMRELAIYTNNGEQLVRAARLVEQAVGFDLFEYSESE